jgi:ribosomal protein L30E
MKANHKDQWVPVRTGKGTTEVFVKRGQFIFGRKTAAKALKMKEPTVQKRMTILKNLGNLITQSITYYSLVTILNYELYQGSMKDEVSPKYHPNSLKVSPKLITQTAPVTSLNHKPYLEGDIDEVSPILEKETEKSITNKNVLNKKNIGRSKDTDPRVKGFFTYWSETFLQETGQPYVFSFGKEGKLAKDLLQVHSLETLQEITKLFFRDEQCKRRGPTIGIFFQEINRLLGMKGMNPLEQAKRELGWG